MFITSKKTFRVRRGNGEIYIIPRSFIGDIPEDVAENWLIKAAINAGDIATPSSHKDSEIEAAVKEADEVAAEKDIRPDAETVSDEAVEAESTDTTAKKTSRKKKAE